jgi:hypothetical protein
MIPRIFVSECSASNFRECEWLFHTAARLVRGGRRKTLKIAATWPWAAAIITAWTRILTLPHPT